MAKIEVRLNPDSKPSGSDLAVVNAARRSFNKRSTWDNSGFPHGDVLKESDKRLLEFLARGMTSDDFQKVLSDFKSDWSEDQEVVDKLWEWRNTPTHDTPFNHCWISFEVKAPIFVARQLVKHEYLVMSEFSRRYITDNIEFYEPDYFRKASEDKKQGSLEEPTTEQPSLFRFEKDAKNFYESLVFDYGVAPEQARMILPQHTMTEWTWSGTLGAFAKMCQLRLHPDAQYETRVVAKQIYGYLQKHYPVSSKLLVEGVTKIPKPDTPS